MLPFKTGVWCLPAHGHNGLFVLELAETVCVCVGFHEDL